MEDIIDDHPLGKIMRTAEDLFFAYCGRREDVKFKVPRPDVAMRFSISNDSYNALKLFDKKKNPKHYYFVWDC